MKATSLIYYVELYLTLLGASAKKRKKKKKAGFNSLMGALSYWTKQGNISPAGSRAWAPIWTPDASRLPCSERWASSFHNKTHSCSFCSHSHTGHAHTRCLGCTLPLTARRIRSTVRRRSVQTRPDAAQPTDTTETWTTVTAGAPAPKMLFKILSLLQLGG